jgi:hypothetical protein
MFWVGLWSVEMWPLGVRRILQLVSMVAGGVRC